MTVRFGFILLLVLIVISLIGPVMSGYGYDEIHLTAKNHPPGSSFLFGSDDLGRDVFTRTCLGLRISLFVGAVAALIDLGIGVIVGAVGALSSERVETVVMRITDAVYAMPYVLLVMFLLLVFGPGLLSMMLSIASIGWVSMARISLYQFKQICQQEYVIYAKSMNASKWWILRKHLLPNSYKTIGLSMTMSVPTAIFMESFLSFLGLGIQAPKASLGTMISEGLSALEYYPWRVIFPVISVALLILSFNLIAESGSKHEQKTA
mgnify:CR=1 FL=1